jgi:hypothetical protein
MLTIFKGCPRCTGDLFPDRDLHGRYLECLQCGYVRNLQGQPSAEMLLVEEERTPALADYIRKNGGAKWLCQESMAS